MATEDCSSTPLMRSKLFSPPEQASLPKWYKETLHNMMLTPLSERVTQWLFQVFKSFPPWNGHQMPPLHANGVQVRLLPRHPAKPHLSSLANIHGRFCPLGKFYLNRPQKQTQDSAITTESPSLLCKDRRYQSMKFQSEPQTWRAWPSTDDTSFLPPQQKMGPQRNVCFEAQSMKLGGHYWHLFTMNLAKNADHHCLAFETYREKFQ